MTARHSFVVLHAVSAALRAAAAAGFTCAVTGDGADELFGGYRCGRQVMLGTCTGADRCTSLDQVVHDHIHSSGMYASTRPSCPAAIQVARQAHELYHLLTCQRQGSQVDFQECWVAIR